MDSSRTLGRSLSLFLGSLGFFFELKSVAFRGGDRRSLDEMLPLGGMVVSRGACHHPDGSMRFLRTGLHVFNTEVELHLAGHCSRTSSDVVLPTAGTR
jgi:hypothetical protein